MEGFILKPIGILRTPYKNTWNTPRQGRFSKEICEIEVFKEYEKGLEGIEEYSYLIILYWLHKAERNILLTYTSSGEKKCGVFATRSPNRPNPIGLSVVKLVERKRNILKIVGIDAIDGTPLLDIKPYFQELDNPQENNATL
ncbi:MAG: tRNA (N6-threonylcarbamoyladenosine(37)-N6)-methyltransferase TrmO [Thermofilum sp. ex4484_79]|nr:MAG: tRNA (N6-threonylcarbamoyladenosine(37)-N6)-methyltransferase TrmO [Thermofilum sp. ex4484_79]